MMYPTKSYFAIVLMIEGFYVLFELFSNEFELYP